jgi:hypothetical protein
VSPDLIPVPPKDGPIVTPDVAVADNRPITPDTAPVLPPDATTDNLPVEAEVGTVTPDAAVDTVKTDAGPVPPVDAPIGGHTDAADGGAVADDSGTEAGSLPASCEFRGGTIVANLTLVKACSPYLIRDYLQIVDDAILTIEPGVTLKFEGALGIDVGSSNGGKLVAVGTAADPIVFTSNATPALPGDWRAIHLWDGTLSGTKIAYAKLDYCGADRSGCIVGDGVGPNLVTIDHVTIDHVGDSHGILEYDVDSNFVITNSSFSNIPDGRYAISVQPASFAGIGANNTFSGGAMIEIYGGPLGSSASWVDPGTPIWVTGSVYVEGTAADNPVLTIGPGVTLMFGTGTALSIGASGSGSLVIAGTAANRVSLTSLAPLPDLGDWIGVEVWASGKAQISYADISYGGSDGLGGGNLILENGNSPAELVVDHSSFTYSRGYGIYLDCAGATVTPVASVQLNAGITYAHNESDMTNTQTMADNVGPGLHGPDCPVP